MGLREAITKDARRILEKLYEDPELAMPNHAGRPGEKCHLGRAKDVETLFGPITLRRNYFYCESSDEGRAPLDDALGLVNGYSPSVVRLSNRAAARTGYGAASSDLAALANIHLDGRQIQRLVNLAAPLVAAQRDQVRLARDLSSDPIRPQVHGEPELRALRGDQRCGEIDQALDLFAVELHVGHRGQV